MAVPDHPRPAVSTRRGNILMVDDCPTTRAWMSAALEARGWRVLALADGAAALAVARVLRFDAIVQRLNQAFATALKDPDVLKRFNEQGMQSFSSTPEEFGKYMQSEQMRWSALVKASGASID